MDVFEWISGAVECIRMAVEEKRIPSSNSLITQCTEITHGKRAL